MRFATKESLRALNSETKDIFFDRISLGTFKNEIEKEYNKKLNST